MSDLEYMVEDAIATIRLNRPARKNSFTYEMIDAWADAVNTASADDAVRCVVLTGAGDAFCAGVDLDARKTVENAPYSRMQVLTRRVHSVARALQTLDKPIIAAVNGPAVGAGMDMALMCDIRLASATARFFQGYIRVGLIPGDGGCYLLPRLVGLAKALELMWTGDHVGAEEAAAIGLVSKVVPPEDLMHDTYEFARRLAAAPPIAVAAIKRVTYQSLDVDFATSLRMAAAESAVVQSTRDSVDSQAAPRAKRPPDFVPT